MVMFHIVSKVNAIVSEMTAAEIILGSNYLLREDLGLNTRQIARLLFNIEDAFGFTFTDSDFMPEQIKNMENLYTLASKYFFAQSIGFVSNEDSN